MRKNYDWALLRAEFQLAKVKHPGLSMAAFSRSRGIPDSTFRKALLRESRRESRPVASDNSLHLKSALQLLNQAKQLINKAL